MGIRILGVTVAVIVVIVGLLSALVGGGVLLPILLTPLVTAVVVLLTYRRVPMVARGYRLRYEAVDHEAFAKLVEHTWVALEAGPRGLTIYLPTTLSTERSKRILKRVFERATVKPLEGVVTPQRQGQMVSAGVLDDAIREGQGTVRVHFVYGPFGPVCWQEGGWMPAGLGRGGITPGHFVPDGDASPLLMPRSPLLDVAEGGRPTHGYVVGEAVERGQSVEAMGDEAPQQRRPEDVKVPGGAWVVCGASPAWLGTRIEQHVERDGLFVVSPHRELLGLADRFAFSVFDPARASEAVHLPLMTTEEVALLQREPWKGVLWLSWLFEALGNKRISDDAATLIAALLAVKPKGALWVGEMTNVLAPKAVEMALNSDWAHLADRVGQRTVERLAALGESADRFTLTGEVNALRQMLSKVMASPATGALWKHEEGDYRMDRLWIVGSPEDRIGMAMLEWWLRKRLWFGSPGASVHVHGIDRLWPAAASRAWLEWAISEDTADLVLEVNEGWDDGSAGFLLRNSTAQVFFAPGADVAWKGDVFSHWGLRLPAGEIAALPDGVGVVGWRNGEGHGIRVFEARRNGKETKR
jgi:hypothetical protein